MFFFMTLAISAGAGALSISPFLILMEFLARKQIPLLPLRHLLGSALFCLSLSTLLAAAGVPPVYEMKWNADVNLIPFLDFAKNPSQYMRNVLLFLPIGLLLPLLYRSFQKLSRCVLYGFFLSLGIELVQLLGFSTTDVNELLMNTLGTVIGYGIFLLLGRLYPPLTEDYSLSGPLKEKLPALFELEAFILTAVAWIAAFSLTHAFKNMILEIFL